MDNDAAFLIKIFITDTYIKVFLMQVPNHSNVQVDLSDSISISLLHIIANIHQPRLKISSPALCYNDYEK